MVGNMMILGFSDYELQAKSLAGQLGMRYACVQVHHFPDGENKLTLPGSLPRDVIFCRSLNLPNEKLIELLFAAKTARRLGAQHLTLVAPYLCYMRQDEAFHEGEVISQTIIGEWLASLFDRVVTLDPHLHRTPEFSQAVPAREAVALTAAGLIGAFIARRIQHPFVLGPDEESLQWAQAVAEPCGFDFAVCTKERFGDADVRVRMPGDNLQGRHVVLVDDIASTGQTLISVAERCLAQGAAQVDVFVSHALFVGEAVQRIRQAGVKEIWSTDSVAHTSNVIELAGLLADALR